MWNAPYYGSCDLIMGISKQSDNIHREVLKQNGFGVYDYDSKSNSNSNGIITGYVPHGLDHNIYKPLPDNDPAYVKILEQVKTKNDAEFVVFWNNRNIRRKQPADVILAFKLFNDMLPEEQRSKTMLLMHTSAVDTNGTDLRAVAKHIAPNCKIVFSEAKLPIQDLNAVYNSVDVVINIASNEGWGLSSTEALLSGTPIINNVTGGLQDQCGFRNEHGKLIEFTQDFPTNHKAKYADHGVWVKPIFPSNRSIQGSVATPFIFDDRVQSEHVAVAIYDWYITEPEQRKAAGLAGREFCLENGLTSEQMGNKMIEMMDMLISQPITRPRYTFNKVEEKQYENIGIS